MKTRVGDLDVGKRPLDSRHTSSLRANEDECALGSELLQLSPSLLPLPACLLAQTPGTGAAAGLLPPTFCAGSVIGDWVDKTLLNYLERSGQASALPGEAARILEAEAVGVALG